MLEEINPARLAQAKEPPAKGKPVGAVIGAVRVLYMLAMSSKPVGVTAIARELDLYPGTCFNILQTLAQQHMVQFDPDTKTYSLGIGVLELAHGLLKRSGHLQHLRPRMRAVSAEYDVTCYLLRLTDPEHVVMIDTVGAGSALDVQFGVGRRFSPFQGAMARVAAAYSELDLDTIMARIKDLTWHRRPTKKEITRDIAGVRAGAVAIDRDRLILGLTAVAVPVLDERGNLVMILTANGASSNLPDGKISALANDLRELADEAATLVVLMRT